MLHEWWLTKKNNEADTEDTEGFVWSVKRAKSIIRDVNGISLRERKRTRIREELIVRVFFAIADLLLLV